MAAIITDICQQAGQLRCPYAARQEVANRFRDHPGQAVTAEHLGHVDPRGNVEFIATHVETPQRGDHLVGVSSEDEDLIAAVLPGRFPHREPGEVHGHVGFPAG